MSNLNDSGVSGFTPRADARDPEQYKRQVAEPTMRAVDALPPAYRALVHEFGYVDIYRAYLRRMTPEKIRAKVRDGVFVL